MEENRREDLAKGFRHAFAEGRAEITLTPLERRQSFILDALLPVSYAKVKVSALPIAEFADVYDLNTPCFKSMFHTDEARLIQEIIFDFTQERAYATLLKETLETELAALIRSHNLYRDSLLEEANRTYETNYFVEKKRQSKEELDTTVEFTNLRYQNQQIYIEDRDYYIQEARDWYESVVNTPSFQAGLLKAERLLKERKIEIAGEHNTIIQHVKESVNYDVREKATLQEITRVCVAYNVLLVDLLSRLNPFDESISDINDLRSSK